MDVFKKFFLLITLIFGCFGIGMSGPANSTIDRYGTERLRIIADYTGISSIMDTIADGEYYGILRWNEYPLNITVKNGEVRHIGIQLFSALDRDSMPSSPIYDFLERYLLETQLENVRKNYIPHHSKADEIIVEKGNLKSLFKVCGDSTIMFSSILHNGRRYSVSWSRKENDILKISFPASNRLLRGYTFDEGVKRIPTKILYTDQATRKSLSINKGDLELCDSTRGSYFIKKGDYCIIPSVNNDRYYFVNDSITDLIYGSSYPIESLSNLLVTGEIQNGFTANLRMLRYGGKMEEFKVPLNSLINFFIDEEGCIPYFGLKGYNTEEHRIIALYEMVHTDTGIEH